MNILECLLCLVVITYTLLVINVQCVMEVLAFCMQSKAMGLTQDAQPCDPFNVPSGSICVFNPLPTPWSADVDPSNPLPEYPRPQMRRERWLSLNGIWEFEPYG